MFFVERFNGRGWHTEVFGLANRGEALQAIDRLRMHYRPRTLFRIVVR
jgi:hypothetical protein